MRGTPASVALGPLAATPPPDATAAVVVVDASALLDDADASAVEVPPPPLHPASAAMASARITGRAREDAAVAACSGAAEGLKRTIDILYDVK